MELAAANVVAAGLEDRITLRAVRIEDMTDTEVCDLAWMPAPFLPRAESRATGRHRSVSSPVSAHRSCLLGGR